MNSSKDEYFDDSVEEFSKAFSISGYNFKHSKTQLRKFRDQDPVKLIKSNRQEKKSKPGCKIFYVGQYDPRVQHPRKSLSRHYHHIASNPVLAGLFARSNLVVTCKRLPNLREILSPTEQGSGYRTTSAQRQKYPKLTKYPNLTCKNLPDIFLPSTYLYKKVPINNHPSPFIQKIGLTKNPPTPNFFIFLTTPQMY